MFINILLGLCGIVLYTLLTAGITFANKGFNLKEMVANNGMVWFISTAVIAITALVFEYHPQSAEFLGSQFGIDLVKYSENYLTFGFAVTPLIKAWQNRTQNK